MRVRTIAVAALVGAALLPVMAGPASATTEIASDPLGDSNSYYSDITDVGATYSETTIGLGLFTVLSWSPSTWTSGDAINWQIEVNGDSLPDFEVWWNQYGANVYDYDPDTIGARLCDASPSYVEADDHYFVGFPASCIGTPSQVRVRGYINLGYTSAYDFAPSHNSYNPFAYRDVPAPPPTTTTTTTKPKPKPTTTTTQPPAPDPVVNVATVATPGYWMLADNGVITPFGGAKTHGAGQFVVDPATVPPFVDLEPTPSGNGYWTLEAGGAVRPYGDAPAFPPGNPLPAGDKYVSMSVAPDGGGLWLYTAKGQVVTRGNAGFFGDMTATVLNADVLDSVATPDGKGYWMVAADGGIFSFGNAKFYGSMGGLRLNKPVMSMAADPDGTGYWLVASDGGIFAFDAKFHGSMGAVPLAQPVSGMVPGTDGYLMVAEDGGVFAFGNVAFHGSLGSTPSPRPVVAIALKNG